MHECLQVKDDVDDILNAFCTPDKFTDSEDVSLLTVFFLHVLTKHSAGVQDTLLHTMKMLFFTPLQTSTSKGLWYLPLRPSAAAHNSTVYSW